MKRFEHFLREYPEEETTITITCRDQDKSLQRMLEYIQRNGNIGHSFPILVDAGARGDRKWANGASEPIEQKFYWDGDGSDYIKDIKVTKVTKG